MKTFALNSYDNSKVLYFIPKVIIHILYGISIQKFLISIEILCINNLVKLKFTFVYRLKLKKSSFKWNFADFFGIKVSICCTISYRNIVESQPTKYIFKKVWMGYIPKTELQCQIRMKFHPLSKKTWSSLSSFFKNTEINVIIDYEFGNIFHPQIRIRYPGTSTDSFLQKKFPEFRQINYIIKLIRYLLDDVNC